MLPESDSRIAAFMGYVAESDRLCNLLNSAEQDAILASNIESPIANPKRRNHAPDLKAQLAGFSNLAILRSRHAQAKLRLNIHLAKGRTSKQAALDAVREILLDAVGGESSLTTCPIGLLAQHYLTEIQKARPWPSAIESPEKANLHLSEVMQAIDRAIGETDLIRRERKDPPTWLLEQFEKRQLGAQPQKQQFSSSPTTARNSSKNTASGWGG